jgi:hypothetical protein
LPEEIVTMKEKLTQRVTQLEKRGSTVEEVEEPPLRITLWRHGQKLSLDHETCLRILRESGYSTASVWLDRIPDGLSAEELTRYLRENGATICGG